MTIRELELAVLTRNVPEHALCKGDVGAVVHIYENGTAFEVEFVTGTGETIEVLTLPADGLRTMSPTEVLHVRDTRSG